MKFIYGKEGYLINQEVNKLIKEYNIEPIVYCDDDSLEDIILDISTVSMFCSQKLLHIKNHQSLFKDMEVERFINILDSLKDVKIIFSFEVDKIDKKNKLIKFLLQKAECKEFKAINSKNIINIIKKIIVLKKGTISNKAAISLANKLPPDLRIIVLEIEKLLYENTQITQEMIETSIGEYLIDDFFSISNALSSGDAENLINSYNKKKKMGIDVIQIISQISSILSLSLIVSSYKEQGFSNIEIANKMKIHIFRVKCAMQLINSLNKDINILIKSLSDLDANIKMGKINPNQGMEIYLLNSIK